MERHATRLVFAGGGTAGHLYPALATAAELRRRHAAASIVFVGVEGGPERRLVPQSGFELRTLAVSGLKGRGLVGKLFGVLAAATALVRCAAWMVRERPSLVVGSGGYVSGPAVLAAALLRVRTMVMEQNHYPGATNRWLAPLVQAVCLPSEAARPRIGGRRIVTGNPVRREFFAIAEPAAGPVPGLLVFGGSRGARSINRAMGEALPLLARLAPPPRITHQTGEADECAVREAYAAYPGEHEVRAFFDDMPVRLAAAALVVCRAGASTLSELCAAGRAAILVPYPHAADDHQRRNAEVLQDAGAALVVDDAALAGTRLAHAITTLLADAARLRAMGRAARGLAQPDAAARIADVADELLGGRRVP